MYAVHQVTKRTAAAAAAAAYVEQKSQLAWRKGHTYISLVRFGSTGVKKRWQLTAVPGHMHPM
jgi:uncharacterized protein (DUF885 family)